MDKPQHILDDKPKENCGVIGIYSLTGANVIPMAIDALRALQHRGQEAWGLAIPNKPPPSMKSSNLLTSVSLNGLAI